MRFFLLAFLLNRYGAQARTIIEERLGFWVTRRRRRAGRRHHRRALPVLIGSVLIVPSFLIFAMRPCAGCGRLRSSTGVVMTSRPGTIRMRGSARLRRARWSAACALLLVLVRARAGSQQSAQVGLRARVQVRPQVRPRPEPKRARPASPAAAAAAASAASAGPRSRRSAAGWSRARPGSNRTCRARRRHSTSWARRTRDAAKDATDAVIGLPNARVVTARERCARGAERRARLPGGGRYALPRQGIPDRQEPRYPVGAEMSGKGPARGPHAQRRRMSDGDIRHARGVPVAAQML